jgi:hypothetical protein
MTLVVSLILNGIWVYRSCGWWRINLVSTVATGWEYFATCSECCCCCCCRGAAAPPQPDQQINMQQLGGAGDQPQQPLLPPHPDASAAEAAPEPQVVNQANLANG